MAPPAQTVELVLERQQLGVGVVGSDGQGSADGRRGRTCAYGGESSPSRDLRFHNGVLTLVFQAMPTGAVGGVGAGRWERA